MFDYGLAASLPALIEREARIFERRGGQQFGANVEG